MKSIIVVNRKKDISGSILRSVTENLSECKTVDFDDVINNSYNSDIFTDSDVIVTIGGDGTIIKTAKVAAEYGKPIIGVNAGRKGYLATIEADNVKELKKLDKGNYRIENRMFINAVITKGESTQSLDCLNEIVIMRGLPSGMSDFNLTICGEKLTYRGDGIIFATPTGSTAYSMAAGGPIVDPSVNCVIITPVCPHSLIAKPMVLHAENKINIHIEKNEGNMILTSDGKDNILFDGKTDANIIISKSDKTVSFIKLNNLSFYKNLASKMV